MKSNEIKEARRMPNGNFVAIDDIVEVSIGFMDDQQLWELINKRSNFTARIVSFESNYVVLDLSDLYRSKQIELFYKDIKSMKREGGELEVC